MEYLYKLLYFLHLLSLRLHPFINKQYVPTLYFYNNVFPEKNKKLFLIIFKKKYKNSTVTFSLS